MNPIVSPSISLRLAVWRYMSVRLLIILRDVCGFAMVYASMPKVFARGLLLALKNNHRSHILAHVNKAAG
jgi:hypothetical protein